MPSLFGADAGSGVNVAANYGRMVPQQTYGVGEVYSNFGTRQLRFIQISAVNNSTAVLFTKDNGLSGGNGYTTVGTGYQASNSVFSTVIRALQTVAEIYYVSAPNTVGFVVAVAYDTANDSDANSNNEGGSWGDLTAIVVDALKAAGLTTAPAATVAAFTIAAA